MAGLRHAVSGIAALCAVSVSIVAAPTTALADPPDTISVVDGVTAPAFDYADAIRERVFIPVAGVDQDGDGHDDQTVIDIIRPRESDGALRVPAIIDPSPYYTTVGRGNETDFIDDVDDDGINDVWPLYYDNYFVPRGYAVILAQMDGTGFSSGCPLHGGPGDIASMRVVVDWLQDRVPGFDASGTPVVADWDNGKAAMIGKSYDGTLANGVAATGVAGLTTIVPISAISSWYDYSRTGGIRHNTDYPASLSNTVTNPDRRALCAPSRTAMSAADGDETGDINDFWRARDYVAGIDNVTASVFAVHGLNDDNVRMSEFDRWWEALASRDIPRKVWLSQEGHVDPFDFRRQEWVDTLHRWFDFWLQGIDNGIMTEPRATIETDANVYADYADWPLPGTTDVDVFLSGVAADAAGRLRLDPSDSATDTLAYRDAAAGRTETSFMAAPTDVHANRLVFLSEPLAQDVRISGTAVISIRAALDGAQSNLGALLVDYGPATRVGRVGEGISNTSTRTCWGSASANDNACYLEVVRRMATTPTWRVVNGVLDSSNRDSLATAAVAVPGQYYDFVWPLQPHDYVFATGHQIGVILVANLSGFVAGSSNVGITVDTEVSKIVLPVVGGLPAAAAAIGLGAPEPSTLTFDLGGHGTAIAPQVVPYGADPSIPDPPTETGWVFDGWFADTAHTAPFDFGDPLTTDATAYAAWSVATYAVDFDLGGHGAPIAAQSIAYGDTPSVPDPPAATGWVFEGWFADSGHTTPFDFDDPVTSDRTAHALWSAATDVTIAPVAGALLVEGRSGPIRVLVATVDPLAPTPQGTVGVLVDGDSVGAPVALAGDGTAIVTLPAMTAGSHVVEADFTPAAGWKPAAAEAGLDVITLEQAVSRLALALSSNTADQGGSIVVTVTGFDEFDEPLGDVSQLVTLESSVATDIIDGNTVTFPHASPHVITATFGAATGQVTVQVNPVIDATTTTTTTSTTTTSAPTTSAPTTPVTTAAADPGSGVLPATGSTISGTIVLALLLSGIGGVLLLARRRLL